VIYDAAHTFGVEYEGGSILEYGDISILSFHATKTYHTIEGGAMIVNDDELYEKIKLMRNFGIKTEETVSLLGTNAKMSEFQAAMGLCNLKTIDIQIRRRKKIYDLYIRNLNKNNKIKFQKIISSKHNFSYMPICPAK